MQTASTDKLKRDLRAVVTDAEELLKATSSQTGERVDQVRARAEDSLRAARARLQDTGRELDQRVHENAWTAVGVAAGVQACGCSPRVPGNPSPLAAPDRLHSGELSFVPSLSRRTLGAPRSIRIAPAPLNSDRLPSMQRRHEQYLTSLLVLILFAAETFAGFEIARDCPPT